MINYSKLFADNMPVTWCYLLENSEKYCSTGFPMGCLTKDAANLQLDTCPIKVCIFKYWPIFVTDNLLSSFFRTPLKTRKSITFSITYIWILRSTAVQKRNGDLDWMDMVDASFVCALCILIFYLYNSFYNILYFCSC